METLLSKGILVTKLAKRQSQKPKRMGSAEEELCDREARYTKLRPMRVEMCCLHWNG